MIPRLPVRGAGLVAVLLSLACGCGASRAAPPDIAACVNLWNQGSVAHRQALAIVVHGALPNTGVFVTTHAPHGEPGEYGTSAQVQIGPGRCVIGQERNTLFVFSSGGWHMVNPNDSSDPALNVVYASDDHPNADSDGEGRLSVHR